MEQELFCDIKGSDFKNRYSILRDNKVDISQLPGEVQDLLFLREYSEEELWYLLSTFHANRFKAEDIYSFLRDVEFDDDCADVLDSYISADKEFLEQLTESCYFDFVGLKWVNEKESHSLMPVELQRSDSVTS